MWLIPPHSVIRMTLCAKGDCFYKLLSFGSTSSFETHAMLCYLTNVLSPLLVSTATQTFIVSASNASTGTSKSSAVFCFVNKLLILLLVSTAVWAFQLCLRQMSTELKTYLT